MLLWLLAHCAVFKERLCGHPEFLTPMASGFRWVAIEALASNSWRLVPPAAVRRDVVAVG